MKQVVCIEHPGLVNDGVPLSYTNAPIITPQEYEQRISALLEHGAAYSHLIVYADKEHFSNLDYLIGYDPRYEECILVLRRDQLPVLILGNEGMGQSLCVTVPHKKVLFQALSPMGQSRVGSDPSTRSSAAAAWTAPPGWASSAGSTSTAANLKTACTALRCPPT